MILFLNSIFVNKILGTFWLKSSFLNTKVQCNPNIVTPYLVTNLDLVTPYLVTNLYLVTIL
jgi:hypothetical protein